MLVGIPSHISDISGIIQGRIIMLVSIPSHIYLISGIILGRHVGQCT